MTPTWVTSSLHAQGYALRAREEQVMRWTMTSGEQRYRHVNQAGFVISARRVLTSATTEKLQRCNIVCPRPLPWDPSRQSQEPLEKRITLGQKSHMPVIINTARLRAPACMEHL